MGMSTTPPSESQQQQLTNPKSSSMFIGAGLPPVPQKLVVKIQSKEFVGMSELILLPNRLGCLKTGQITDDQATSRPRK